MPWPAMIQEWSNGGTMTSPRACCRRSASALRSADVVPLKNDFGAKHARAVDLDGGRGRRHNDHGGHPEQAGCARERLGVIARRVGDHAAGELVAAEPCEHVGGAADLEGAGDLHVLAFQAERRATGARRAMDERCAADDAADACSGGADVVEANERKRGVSVHGCGVRRAPADRQPAREGIEAIWSSPIAWSWN